MQRLLSCANRSKQCLGLFGLAALFVIPLAASVPTALAQQERGSMDMHGGAAMHNAPGKASESAAKDERQVVVISEAERNFVLTEMRAFLESVQGVVDGVAEGNMKDVAAAAKKSGTGVMQHAPRALMKKLPQGFRMLGMDSHKKFDAIAIEANQLGDKGQVLKQLGALLGNCTACHASYRFTVK